MTQRLIYFILLLSLLNTTHAAETVGQVSIHGENLDIGDAASVAIQSGNYLYGGLSLNHISSDVVIQIDNRKTINPLYFFIGLKYTSKVSPFIEAGIDLPEALIDEIFDNEDNAIDLTDYYLSSGLNFSINKKFGISVYAKKYVFKYQAMSLFTTNKVRTDSYGASLVMRF